MDELEQKYRALVERIGGYPMTEAARERIMAEVEAIYRRERVPSAPAAHFGGQNSLGSRPRRS